MVCALAMVMSLGLSASAQSSDAEEQARERFDRGMEFVQQERWTEALAEFDASVSLAPTQNAYFNRALCLRLVGRDIEAYTAFLDVRDRYGPEINTARQAHIERELNGLRERVGRLQIQVVSEVEGATVLLDGAQVGEMPLSRPLVVTPGSHTIEVRADGFRPSEQQISVLAGQELPVRVSLQAVGAGSEPEPPSEPQSEDEPVGPVVEAPELATTSSPDDTPPTGRRNRGLRIAASITTGLAVAALGAGVGLVVWNNSRYDNWTTEWSRIEQAYTSTESEPQDAQALWDDHQENDRLGSSISSMSTVNFVLLGAGGAMAITAVVLWILGSRTVSEPHVSFLPQRGGMTLTIGGIIP